MSKKLILLLVCAALLLAACQPAASGDTTPTPPLESYPAPTNAVNAANPSGYPLPTNPDEVNSTMGAYPGPSSDGGIGSAFPPAPGDEALLRGNFFLESVNLQPVSGQPGQTDLVGSGSLPTPCHLPRVKLNPPDAQKKITIEVYSLVEKDKVCTQNLKPFQGKLATLGGYPAGKYSVQVNDLPAVELTVP